MKYLSYVDVMRVFIERRLLKGISTFTHKDIIRETNTNCPYSVLKYLKNHYELEFSDKESLVKKVDIFGQVKYIKVKFREYKVIKRKDNNVEKPSVRRESKISNNAPLFLGKSFD